MIEEVIKSLDYGTVGHFSWLLASYEGAIKAESCPLGFRELDSTLEAQIMKTEKLCGK